MQTLQNSAGQSISIRNKIVNGIVPDGVPLDKIIRALGDTKDPNSFEMFGFLEREHRRGGVIISPKKLVSCKLVTTAFASYLVDSLQDSTTYPMDAFKYHAVGTGTASEVNTDTLLGNEVESRASGTQIEGASSNIYKSVATITFTGSYAISEHGFFSASTGGTMLDRSLMSPVDNVVLNDQITYTYQLTVNAE